jgi:hypothetical protein
MRPELLISILAIVVAIASFWHSRLATIASIRPVLVFLYDKKKGWHVRNVGGGPALNVTIAIKPPKSWSKPFKIPPIDSGDYFKLSRVPHHKVHELGSTYRDFQGRVYSSLYICKMGHTILRRGSKLPF